MLAEEERLLAEKAEAEERRRQDKLEMEERTRRDREDARARIQELLLLIGALTKKEREAVDRTVKVQETVMPNRTRSTQRTAVILSSSHEETSHARHRAVDL
ncbi:hypothetical protein PI124_g22106 [Phytophthora idaei]|nr:hypothetical protein PI126_g21331 [Phytophthora idaei]KAG3232817.1 hypothetical protein PI124_g22106 [Phytophthora idaei]